MILLVSVGCGEQKEDQLDVTSTTSALGSTKQQQTIGNWTQLTQMTSDGNYLLTADIDANGKTWTAKSFSGTFDGGSHTISNLTVTVNGFNAGFFTTMLSAIVRKVRFINLKVTGQSAFWVGGLAGWSDSSLVEDVGVEATVTGVGAPNGGGIFGAMFGGDMNRCYSKGSVNSMTQYVGGLVGDLDMSGENRANIYQCYSTATVAADTSGSVVYAGGIAGYTYAGTVEEVYATGNVTGRSSVGGLVGFLDCDSSNFFVLNHGIYRGNVTDMNRPPPQGWAGVAGGANNCTGRFDQLFWDTSNDPSTAVYVFPYVDPSFPVQQGAANGPLTSPTTASGGIYHFADNNLQSTIWNAGTSTQHHVLQGMPGGLTIQPR